MRPVQPGEPIKPHITAEWYNQTLHKTFVDKTKQKKNVKNRLILCRTTVEIAGAEINEADTEASVYHSGLVDTFNLIYASSGNFSPGKITRQYVMVNPSSETIPSGTEVWAMEAEGGFLVATIWSC